MKHDLTLKVRDLKFSVLNGVPTSNRCFIARKFGESSEAGTQMTGIIPGAPAGGIKWHIINWNAERCHVRGLQMHIAKTICKIVGLSHKDSLLKCSSRMTGNCHVRFLGGNGAERPLTYPVRKSNIAIIFK